MSIFRQLLQRGVYVVHALRGYEQHERRVRRLFAEHGLPFEFITAGDPSNFHTIDLHNYFTDEAIAKLPTGVLSCTLNHIIAYETLLRDGMDHALIFENDPFFMGYFLKKLQRTSDEAERLEPGFIISLENSTLCFPSYWQAWGKKRLFRAVSGRMAGSYMIDATAAARMLDNLKTRPCNNVIDWWHNDLAARGVVKMYWAHPPLVEQGSHNGSLHSTISSKPQQFSRRVSWVVQRSFRMTPGRLINDRHILE